jgi:hypothetical protein
MHLDHVSFAAGPAGLAATAERLSQQLGEDFVDGGVHPRFGTRNRLLPLARGQYLEVVEVLDHPASDKAPFGQAVRSRSEAGGGWLGWVLAVDDIAKIESRLQRPSVPGNRHRPDGVELRWRQIGVKGLQSDPQLPFFIQWEAPPDHHPSTNATGRLSLEKLEIAGDSSRVADWVGVESIESIGGIDVEWVEPKATPGIVAATFATADGLVRI